MVPEKISEAERALLTEEELEGLLEDEDGGDEPDDEGDDDGNTDVGDGTAKPDDAGTEADHAAAAADAADPDADPAAAAAAAVADTNAAPAAVADPQPDPAPADEPDETQQRTPAWSLPAEVGERIKAIDDERVKLAVEFDDGALTAEELRTKMKALEDERDGLRTRQISAQVSLDLAKGRWLDESVPDFLKQHPQYKSSAVLNQALDAEVRKLQAQSVNPFDPKILAKAHATISGEITSAFKVKETPDPKQDPGNKPAAKTTKREPVPTLAHVPAADITDADDGGEFAYLDRLAETDSVAYEKALAKLSPEKQDRYLAQ